MADVPALATKCPEGGGQTSAAALACSITLATYEPASAKSQARVKQCSIAASGWKHRQEGKTKACLPWSGPCRGRPGGGALSPETVHLM